MRKRRIGAAVALGLLTALLVPSVAMAAGTQNIRAGFQAQNTGFPNPSTAFPFPTFGPASPSEKSGTVGVEVSITNVVGDAPSAQVARIHLPSEMTFESSGLAQVNPDDLAGLPPGGLGPFEDAKVGQGGARALGLGAVGPVNGYNGLTQNGNQTLVLQSFAANAPITLVGELQNSPLGPPYGKVLNVPVSTTVGGGVPPGIVIDLFNTTISRAYTDKKIAKKAKKTKKKAKKASGKKAKKLKKKAKKLKQQSKKNYVSVENCDDGTLSWQAEFTYANAPPQSPVTTQPCA